MAWWGWAPWGAGDGEEGGQKEALGRAGGAGEGGVPPLLLPTLAPTLASPGAPMAPSAAPAALAKPFWWGGSRGEAVGGGRCLGGDGEGWGCILPPPPPITALGL